MNVEAALQLHAEALRLQSVGKMTQKLMLSVSGNRAAVKLQFSSMLVLSSLSLWQAYCADMLVGSLEQASSVGLMPDMPLDKFTGAGEIAFVQFMYIMYTFLFQQICTCMSMNAT